MRIPFLLAPMAELSHRALRELVEWYTPPGAGPACDEYFTEMISASGLLAGGPFEKWYLDAGPCPDRVVYQLAGADAERLTAAAALLDRYECAGIDINMGCAAPAITRTGAGVRWMEDPDRAGAMIRRVRRVTKKRLSVKLRLGPREDFDCLVRFCRRLEAEGVEFITLHPRIAGEKFRRRARWDYVGRLRQELDIPVAGNGDLSDAADLLRRAEEGASTLGGVSGPVMVGRGAVMRPWIFAEARSMEAGTTPPAINPEETGLRFLDLLARYQPPEFHPSRARRFFSYFCDNFTCGNYLKNLLNRETELKGMAAVWSAHFREHPED